MKGLTRLDKARKKAQDNNRYRVIAHRGMWYVITPRGHARPCVSWSLAMGSVGRKRVTS